MEAEKQEIAERFDKEMKQTLLDAANEARTEKGLPLLTLEEIETIGIPAI